MKVSVSHLVGVISLTLLAILPLSANAKGLMLFNTGDEVFSVDKLPVDLAEEYPKDFQLGYYCKHFGIFWADAWTWDCKLSAVSHDKESYADLPNDVVSTLNEQYSMSDADRGIWNHYGLLILATLIGGYLFWEKRKPKSDDTTSKID